MEVGIKIKEYLEENGIFQAHISREAKIGTVKLNLALNGNRRLTFEEYTAICAVLKLSTSYFLEPRLPDTNKEPELRGLIIVLRLTSGLCAVSTTLFTCTRDGR